MKNKFKIGIATCLLSLGVTSAVSANWVSSTMDVPGGNESAYGEDQEVSFNSKDTYSTNATFYTRSRSSYSGMDARIVNSNKVSRSDWARNMNEGDTIYVSTTASKGYNYNIEISSDWTQSGTDSISFSYSPDSE